VPATTTVARSSGRAGRQRRSPDRRAPPARRRRHHRRRTGRLGAGVQESPWRLRARNKAQGRRGSPFVGSGPGFCGEPSARGSSREPPPRRGSCDGAPPARAFLWIPGRVRDREHESEV
jgi:hypothetical protein